MKNSQYETDRKVLRVIASYWRRHGYAPLTAEIESACGYAGRSSVQRSKQRLKSQGLIVTGKGRRNIKLTDAGLAVIRPFAAEERVERLDLGA